MSTFKELGLSNEVLKALTDLGFEKPSEIQQHAIPELLAKDTDLIGLAQTGTGKTAAFGIPLLERIDSRGAHTQALILAPTRELGQQIAEQLELFSKYMPKINVLAVYGGASINKQMDALRRPQHVIIATPGRLIDLIGRNAVKLEQLEMLILDEADEMLNMGFKEDIDHILSFTPETKLTWLFSATMPKEIKRIVNRYMTNPVEVKVNTKNEVNKDIEHQYTVITRANKTEALCRFLDIDPDMRGVVFCRTKRDTQNLAEALMKRGYKADALHGDLSQPQRDRVMKRFKDHALQVLVATDVAARGIDVNDLTHVFHFSLPDDGSYYTHRSGRTARAGKKGISIAFINGREKRRILELQKALGITFKKVLIPNNDNIMELRVRNWCQEVLNTPAGNVADSDVVEVVSLMFGNLTKDELIAKITALELSKLQLGTSDDLNLESETEEEHAHTHGGKRSRRRNDRNQRHQPRSFRKPSSKSHSNKKKGGHRKGSSSGKGSRS